MSLKGSLKTAALPEVLNFLSNNGKTGEFHVSGSHGEGRLWLTEGRISGFHAAKAEKPFEAIFELLRIEDGEFTFDAEAEPTSDLHETGEDDGQVGPALEAAEARMAEWREIVQVVPSLSHRLHLRSERPADDVILDPDQWLMVVAIGAGHTVGEVIDERGLQEFDGCRAVRALVDAALVEAHEPEVPEPELHQPEMVAPDGAEAEMAEPGSVEPEMVEPEMVEPEMVQPEMVEAEPEMVEPVVAASPLAAFGYGAVTEEPAAYTHFATSGEPVAAEYPFDAEAVADVEQVEADSPYHADETPEGDHYAALRAAMVEIGDDLVGDDGEGDEAEPAQTYEFRADPQEDGRAALQALLSEVTADAGAGPVASDDHLDGLADRGPWTQHELTAMDSDYGWHDQAEEASNIVPFAPVHTEAEAAEAAGDAETVDTDEVEEPAPVEEPINRGLLLKFLSSVRN